MRRWRQHEDCAIVVQRHRSALTAKEVFYDAPHSCIAGARDFHSAVVHLHGNDLPADDGFCAVAEGHEHGKFQLSVSGKSSRSSGWLDSADPCNQARLS